MEENDVMESLEDETTVTLDDLSADLSGDADSTQETEMESTSDSDSSDTVITFPSDYLDTDTFNAGIESVLSAIADDEIEEDYVGEVYSLGSASDPLDLMVPDNYNVFYLGDTQMVFPSSASDDMVLIDGFLVNMGSAVTINVDLSGTASVSNYVVSQVTFPTYGSSNYLSYVSSYGAPYMIVDRYYDSGYLRSVTRNSSAVMTAETITQSSWYGISGFRMYSFIFAVVLIFLMIWGRLRWKQI